MMNWISAVDLAIFREINTHWANPVLDWGLSCVGNIGVMKWLLLALGLFFLCWGGFKGRVFVLLALLCVVIGDPLIANSVKHVVARPRPYQVLENVRRVSWHASDVKVEMVSHGWGKSNSMPSSHVANNMMLVMVFWLVYGWRRWWWLLFGPLIMMLSRVYTGDHFPSDTLAGFLLGAAYTLLICCIADRVWQKYGRRLAPKLYDKYPALLETGSSR